MTNSPTPFPQWQPIQFNQGNGQDLFFGGARSTLRREPRPRNDFRVTGQPQRDEQGRVYVPWTLVLRDFSGGLGRYAGAFETFPNRYADSYGVDESNPGYLILAQLTNSDTSPDPTGNLTGLHWENIFDTLIMGIGSGTNVSLIKETSATDPTPAAITYDPTNTSSITSLSQCVLASADNRLLVGLSGDPAQLIGDASGTVDATLHTDLTSLWGHVQTSLPSTATPGASMHLFYAGTSMFNDMDTASATSTNPTATLTNLPQGGYTIKPGEFALSDGPRRAWFVLPKETNTSGMLLFGTEKLGHVYSFSLDGQEFQKLDFNEMPNGVLIASHGVSPVHGSCIAASDGEHVVIHNGDIEEDLHIFSENLGGQLFSVLDSDWYWRCRGLAWRGANLYARVNQIHRPGTSASVHGWWRYDWEAKSWHIVSSIETLGTGNTLKGTVGVGGDPVSHMTGFTQFYTATAWNQMFLPRPGENPYLLYRMTVGAASTSGNEMENTGELFTPKWTLPGMEGLVSRIDWVRCLGELRDHSTAPGSVTINFVAEREDGPLYAGTGGRYGPTFSGADRRITRFWRNPFNEEFFELQVAILITQSVTSTRVTPQPLPLVIGGRTYLDPGGYK